LWSHPSKGPQSLKLRLISGCMIMSCSYLINFPNMVRSFVGKFFQNSGERTLLQQEVKHIAGKYRLVSFLGFFLRLLWENWRNLVHVLNVGIIKLFVEHKSQTEWKQIRFRFFWLYCVYKSISYWFNLVWAKFFFLK